MKLFDFTDFYCGAPANTDKMPYDQFAKHVDWGWSFVYGDVAVYVTRTCGNGVYYYRLTTESQGVTESENFLTAEELLLHGKICGKTFAEIWDELDLM